MKKLIFAHIITFLILVSCNKDEGETFALPVGDLKVSVLDEFRRPIEGATISFDSYDEMTDSNGEYVFKRLPAQEYEVVVSKESYQASIEKVSIVNGKTTFLEVTLVAGKVHVPLGVVKYESILGNNNQGVQDSVYVLFNEPVSIERIQSNWQSCQSAINFSQTDGGKGVRFSFNCAEMGGKYPFSVTVKDKDGNSLTENIEVPFYHSKFDVEGYISDMLLINEDKEILIATYHPSRIARYSIESNSIVRTYDVSSMMAPLKMSYNPYNDKVYVMGNTNPHADYWYTGVNSPDVYALNYNTGEISKAFTVVPDAKDHPQSPANIPYNIGFTKTGLGIVLLKANGSSALRWKIIDSSKNDTIYTYRHYDSAIITEYTTFVNVDMNFDRSKLLLTQNDGSVDYGIFDERTEKITILRPSSVTRSSQIIPHKKEDKYYMRQLYDQFIMDLNGNLSRISYLDSRYGGNADFSYKANENNIIYVCEADSYTGDPNSFKVLDYNTSITLKACDVIDGLQEFSTTIDGKYGVAHKKTSYRVSSIFTFLTEKF